MRSFSRGVFRPKERIEELAMKLRDYGALGVEELKPIGSKFDASEIIAAARAAVTGYPLQEVIRAIADMIVLPNRNAVRRSVLDRAKKCPFSHMFPEVRVTLAVLRPPEEVPSAAMRQMILETFSPSA